MATGTVRFHRVLRSRPERYRAFLDANAMAKWLPPMASLARSTTWMRASAAPTRCGHREPHRSKVQRAVLFGAWLVRAVFSIATFERFMDSE